MSPNNGAPDESKPNATLAAQFAFTVHELQRELGTDSVQPIPPVRRSFSKPLAYLDTARAVFRQSGGAYA